MEDIGHIGGSSLSFVFNINDSKLLLVWVAKGVVSTFFSKILAFKVFYWLFRADTVITGSMNNKIYDSINLSCGWKRDLDWIVGL